MAASLRSRMDPREDALRTSDLRQPTRTPRTRFPSLTEFPDSPSVYSHAYQSPDANDVNFDAASFSNLSDAADSSSDYEDETASTLRSVSTANAQDGSDVGHYNDDDDASHRISLQGPKIRFHSRAPWETEDPAIGEESDNSSRSGTIGSRFRGKASKADGLIRTFGRGSSITSRPSVDSARSQISATPSFEITAGNYSSSRGALYALARESLSSASLSSTTAPPSFPRATNYPHPTHYATHSSSSRGAVDPGGIVHTSTAHEDVPIPPPSDIPRSSHERTVTQSSLARSQEQSSREEFVHPYANPDLVSPYIPAHTTRDVTKSDSNSTVTDSTSTRSGVFSIMSTETSATSLTSREFPHGSLRVNGKEISSPITVFRPNDTSAEYVGSNTKFLSLHPPPAGFDGHRYLPRSSTVTLISLQEAQARERSRSSTVHTTIVRPSKGREDGGSQLPFPSSDSLLEETEDQSRETSIGSLLARSRARSTSAGARSKGMQHPLGHSHKSGSRDSDSIVSSSGALPARPLKHKKSGFMRLFSGRTSEGDRSPPPPIPPLAEVYPEQNIESQGAGKASKYSLPRVPVPSFSPTLHSAGASSTTLTSANGNSSGGDDPDGKGPSSRRRQPPSLSIVTGAPDCRGPTSAGRVGSPSTLALPHPPLSLTVPQSAPPGTTDFQGLKLRPVSTSFSSHFADIVVGVEEQSHPEVSTPSSAASPGTAVFPFTPVSTRQSDDTPATAVEPSGEQCLTVKGLQEQLVSAKKAWQQQVWELQGQIRDLTAELEDLRVADKGYCEVCGRGKRHPSPTDEQLPKKVGVVNRPRARTGDATRFASGK